MAIGFLPSPAFAGWPFRVAYRFPLPGTRRGATVRSSDVTRGSGKQADLFQMLTPSSPPGRPAPARRLDGRVAAASHSALAREPRPSRVVRRPDRPAPRGGQPPPAAPQRRDGDSAPAAPTGRILTARARSRVLPFPEERGFPRSPGSRVVGIQRTLAFSEVERGAPLGTTRAPFDPTRREVRHGVGLRLGQKGGHPARHFRLPARHFYLPVAGNAWVTLPPSTGRWMRPRSPATTRSGRGRAGNSRSPELLV